MISFSDSLYVQYICFYLFFCLHVHVLGFYILNFDYKNNPTKKKREKKFCVRAFLLSKFFLHQLQSKVLTMSIVYAFVDFTSLCDCERVYFILLLSAFLNCIIVFFFLVVVVVDEKYTVERERYIQKLFHCYCFYCTKCGRLRFNS